MAGNGVGEIKLIGIAARREFVGIAFKFWRREFALRQQPMCHSKNGRGIEPAADLAAQRQMAARSAANAVAEHGAIVFDIVLFASIAHPHIEWREPVTLMVAAVRTNPHRMRRLQPQHILPQRFFARDPLIGDHFGHHPAIDHLGNARNREDRGDIAGDDQPLAIVVIMQRFLPDVIARAERFLPRCVPHHEGEFAVDVSGAILAPNLIGVQYQFGIAAIAQGCTPAQQVAAKLLPVAEPAVENHDQALIGIGKRLRGFK